MKHGNIKKTTYYWYTPHKISQNGYIKWKFGPLFGDAFQYLVNSPWAWVLWEVVHRRKELWCNMWCGSTSSGFSLGLFTSWAILYGSACPASGTERIGATEDFKLGGDASTPSLGNRQCPPLLPQNADKWFQAATRSLRKPLLMLPTSIRRFFASDAWTLDSPSSPPSAPSSSFSSPPTPRLSLSGLGLKSRA